MIPPKVHISATAAVPDLAHYEALYRRAAEDPDGYWLDEARRLDWYHPPTVGGAAHAATASFTWFAGGRLNATASCIDRHAASMPDKTAILWAKNEPGDYQPISFRELSEQVGRLANALLAAGVQRGDRVCIYLPMIPEAVYAMLACARIGAVHSVVFGGFSAESLRERILDARCKVLITANEGLRGGRPVHLKAIADAAVEGLACVERVLVARRTDTPVPMEQGRDLWLDEEMARQRPYCPAAWMDAEDPLFILYTSGSTGKPKGVLHTTGGYLTYAASTFRLVFDLKPDDVYFCTADVGWITGHSYIVYGPLAHGVTTVLFESIPTYPDASRLWQVVDDVGATIVYTAPTALRTLMQAGDEPVRRTRRGTLRILGTVGEPINPEVWRWYHDVVGEGRAAVVDTWWQTETGGMLIAPLPGATPCKPGSATLPLPGVLPVLLDDQGREIEGNGVRGNLCLRGSWPGQARTIWGDHRRFLETYYKPYPGYYFTGDGCERDRDGYYWITGRVDDVLNVSGHRIGTAEVESALVAHDLVVEAAVVGYPHPIKGQGIRVYVIVREHHLSPAELAGVLKEQVRHAIGPIAVPDQILAVPGLPKTRSGKIMRRILRKIAEGELENLGDLSTLADPGVVEQIVKVSVG